jgi:hypothetical protein
VFACKTPGTGKVDGGGWFASASDEGKAVFSFHAERCDGEEVRGELSYRDEGLDLDIEGELTFAAFCDAERSTGGECRCTDAYEIKFNYRPVGAGASGVGTGSACFYDGGKEGPDVLSDELRVRLDGGPYDGYQNVGLIEGGNIESSECPGNIPPTPIRPVR